MIHPVDAYVGNRLRVARTLASKSQTELAEHIGVTFQQVQKYETGANRVSASRLWMISKFLNVPVATFFPEDPRDQEHELSRYSLHDLRILSQIKGLGDPERAAMQNLLAVLTNDADNSQSVI